MRIRAQGNHPIPDNPAPTWQDLNGQPPSHSQPTGGPTSSIPTPAVTHSTPGLMQIPYSQPTYTQWPAPTHPSPAFTPQPPPTLTFVHTNTPPDCNVAAGNSSADETDNPVVSPPPSPIPSVRKRTGVGVQQCTPTTERGVKSKRAKTSSTPAPSAGHEKGGRQHGSSNYTHQDIKNLLKCVREVLPISQDAWQDVARRFNKKAREQSRPSREWKPLRAKYENLVREASKKPTGSATMPKHLQRVLKLEDKINAKSNIQELDDDSNKETAAGSSTSDSETETTDGEDGSGKGSGESGSDVEPATQPKARHVHKVGRGPTTTSRATATRRTPAHEFLNALSASLNPATREARDEARFARKLAQEQINQLAQENRELRNRNDVLMDRIQQLSAELQEQKAEVKALRTRLEMYDVIRSFMDPSRIPPFDLMRSIDSMSTERSEHKAGSVCHTTTSPLHSPKPV